MQLLKYLLVVLLTSLSFSGFCQNSDVVTLQWKLKPNETIAYKTKMEEVDVANHKDFAMDGLIKEVGGGADTLMKQVFKQLQQQANDNSNLITYVKEKRKGVIDIEMFIVDGGTKLSKDTSEAGKRIAEMQAMMQRATKGVMLRGAVYENGTIASFYTKSDQKNLVSMLFELPGRAVKIGDTWSLNMNFISMDQNFTCDSSYKRNIVTLVNITNAGEEHIANLKYDIIEYVDGNFVSPFSSSPVKTTMKMTFQGTASFSIEKGRWKTYDGIMSLSSTGLMTSQSSKKFSLIEK